MVARIKSVSVEGNGLYVHSVDAWVDVVLTGDRSNPNRTVSRADFLDAIRTELNVIIIDKADLPEVEPDGDAEGHGGARIPRLRAGALVGYADDLASNHRLTALGHLALAECLDAPLPVDEAQVEALRTLIDGANTGVNAADSTETLARRLVERGVRVEAGEQP